MTTVYIGYGLLVLGAYLLYRGTEKERQLAPDLAQLDSRYLLYPVVFDRTISNCSKRKKDQAEIDSETPFSNGKRYYT
jgi:hypothetical protein